MHCGDRGADELAHRALFKRLNLAAKAGSKANR